MTRHFGRTIQASVSGATLNSVRNCKRNPALRVRRCPLLLCWRRGRRRGEDHEAELALAVLLEEHGHAAVRQHGEVAVARGPLVLLDLPGPGLPLVVAAAKGPWTRPVGRPGPGVEDDPRLSIAARPAFQTRSFSRTRRERYLGHLLSLAENQSRQAVFIE